MPAQGEPGVSYRRIPVDHEEGARLNAFRDTRVLTEAALAVALSFVLGFIVLFKMPFGGSVSLEMIPLILLALRQGWRDSSSRRYGVPSSAPRSPFLRASCATFCLV